MHLTLYSITGGSSAGPGEGAGEGAGQCAEEGARAGELQSGDGEVCVHPLLQGVQTARIACKTFKEKPLNQFYRVYLHRLQELATKRTTVMNSTNVIKNRRLNKTSVCVSLLSRGSYPKKSAHIW